MAPTAPVVDQIVKGAPAPDASPNDATHAGPPPPYTTYQSHALTSPTTHDAPTNLKSSPAPAPPQSPSDPTALLPSSPPQIYLNLLIMEASLRSQYLTLRARRRQNTFVLTLLTLWILFYTYVLWLRPRADGSGSIGGSKYWLVDMAQKVCFITGVVTALLFWATGQWERGVRWPRRWVAVTNRGLRGINAKIVVVRGSWWSEVWNWLAFVLPFSGGLWGGDGQGGSSYHFINVTTGQGQAQAHGQAWDKKYELGGTSAVDARRAGRHVTEDGKAYLEEDIAAGGDLIKLLLLPKPFTPDFREGWDDYRSEYWEKENERRAELRKRVRARRRDIAREQGGMFWWTGWRGLGWRRGRASGASIAGGGGKSADGDRRTQHSHHHHHSSHHQHAHQRETLSATSSLRDKERKRRPSSNLLRGRTGSTHSRSSSRSTTPSAEPLDDQPSLVSAQQQQHFRPRPVDHPDRRWSTSTTDSVVSTATASTSPPPASASGTTTTAASTADAFRRTVRKPSLASVGKRASTLSTAESLEEQREREEEDGIERERGGATSAVDEGKRSSGGHGTASTSARARSA